MTNAFKIPTLDRSQGHLLFSSRMQSLLSVWEIHTPGQRRWMGWELHWDKLEKNSLSNCPESEETITWGYFPAMDIIFDHQSLICFSWNEQFSSNIKIDFEINDFGSIETIHLLILIKKQTKLVSLSLSPFFLLCLCTHMHICVCVFVFNIAK